MTTILVIEDEKPLREEIADTLGFEGFDVLVAENGQAGVQLAREQLPELIVCDVTMPQLDGYGVLAALRESASTTVIPFMFLTARADKSFMRHGMELGADDYLTKPFTRGELLEAIRARLERSAAIAQTYDDHLEGAKATLTRMVAHELRTPLISLRTVKDIMNRQLNQMNPESMKELIDSMGSGIERLTHVVEQTIYLTHLETGMLRVEAILQDGFPTPIGAILNRSIDLARQFAYRNRDGVIDTQFANETAEVRAHSQALKHAFAELIANALSFSDEGSEIRITQYATRNSLTVTITDCGVGIPCGQQKEAFKKFTQINRAAQEQQGIGLGLHVAQRIIEAHSGTLTLTSKPEEGTQIVVTLPLSRANIEAK